MSNIPKNLKYTATHEWVLDGGDGTATIGITDHAQELLGDVVFVELPEVEKKLTAGQEFIVVESVKAAADVYSPVAGQVVEVNSALVNTPDLINKDPYGEGWLCKIKVADGQAISQLLNAESYEQGLDH